MLPHFARRTPFARCGFIVGLSFVFLATSTVATASAGEYEVIGDMLFPHSGRGVTRVTPQFFSLLNPYPSSLWPLGQSIPYTFASAGYSSDYQATVVRALQHISQKTCLTFQDVTNSASVPTEHLNFLTADRCNAVVGRVAGQTSTVNLSPTTCDFGSVVHEIGHTLGLLHTHSRPDAGNYVVINYGLIPASLQGEYTAISSGVPLGPYDYGSVMHYGTQASGNTVMAAPRAIGQRQGLSSQDVEELNFLYTNCQSGLPKCMVGIPATGTKLGVGQSLSVNFYYNERGSGSGSVAATATFSLPTGVTASLASGATVSPLSSTTLTFTPVQAQAGTAVTLSVSFTSTSSGQSVTCSAAVNVLAISTQLECFGLLASDAGVCNGRGTCTLTDLCVCSSGFAGPECAATTDGLVAAYNGLAPSGSSANAADFSTGVGISANLNQQEDWQFDWDQTGTLEYEVRKVGMYLAVEQNAAVTLTFADSSGQQLFQSTLQLSPATGADGSVSANVFWNFSLSGMGSFPIAGTLRASVASNVRAVWRSGSTQMIRGVDNTATGSVAPSRLFFALYGVLRCKDGAYGVRCQSTCPGGLGAAQCNGRGRCRDGVEGTGQCVCVGNFSPDSGCASCLGGWSGSDCSTVATPSPASPVTVPSPIPIPQPVTVPSPVVGPSPSPVYVAPTPPTAPVYVAPNPVAVAVPVGQPTTSSKSTLSSGAIAAIVIGSVIGVAALILIGIIAKFLSAEPPAAAPRSYPGNHSYRVPPQQRAAPLYNAPRELYAPSPLYNGAPPYATVVPQARVASPLSPARMPAPQAAYPQAAYPRYPPPSIVHPQPQLVQPWGGTKPVNAPAPPYGYAPPLALPYR